MAESVKLFRSFYRAIRFALPERRAVLARAGQARALAPDRWARIYSRFNEVLSGVLIVRSFTMEESEKNRFLRDVAEANNLVIRGVASDTGYGAASNCSRRWKP